MQFALLSQENQTIEMKPPNRALLKSQQQLKAKKELEFQWGCISIGKWPHLEIHNFDGRGRGLVCSKPFKKGDVVCHYHGIVYEGAEARAVLRKRRELFQTSYVFEIRNFKGQYYVIDATIEDYSQGRLINHGIHGNVVPKPKKIKGYLFLLFVASKTIEKGEEMLYDYGQRATDGNDIFPWLNTCPCSKCVTKV